MLTFTVIGPGQKYGDYAAGYFRPSAPGEFVPLVTGCPTELVATAEALRLADEAAARAVTVFQDHRFRVHARGAFLDDNQGDL